MGCMFVARHGLLGRLRRARAWGVVWWLCAIPRRASGEAARERESALEMSGLYAYMIGTLMRLSQVPKGATSDL